MGARREDEESRLIEKRGNERDRLGRAQSTSLQGMIYSDIIAYVHIPFGRQRWRWSRRASP